MVIVEENRNHLSSHLTPVRNLCKQPNTLCSTTLRLNVCPLLFRLNRLPHLPRPPQIFPVLLRLVGVGNAKFSPALPQSRRPIQGTPQSPADRPTAHVRAPAVRRKPRRKPPAPARPGRQERWSPCDRSAGAPGTAARQDASSPGTDLTESAWLSAPRPRAAHCGAEDARRADRARSLKRLLLDLQKERVLRAVAFKVNAVIAQPHRPRFPPP
jgi:hypothetical protein